MNLHVRESVPASDGSAGTIVFIHGFPFDGSMWSHQLGALPEGWRGLAPDLRGFGDTDIHHVPGEVSTGRTGGGIALDDEPVLTMACFADDIAAMLDDLDPPGAVICGLSMGGYVALEIWRRHPHLVRALVLADTRAGSDNDEGRENRLRTAQTVRSAGAEPIARAMIPALLTRETRESRPEVVDHVRRMILATPPTTLIGALAGMAARHDHTRELHHIPVPTLVLVGEEDGITPPADARSMADAIPGARYTAIQGAGHLSPLERPDAFNAALAEFLAGLDA